MKPHSRRDFLADVGRGMLVASLGPALAADLGLATASAADGAEELSFGKLEPLVAMLQENAPAKLLPLLVGKLKDGTDLRTLVAAGALANARSFGGRHYEGYHTFMALAPAFEMARELPEAQRPLPVLKVLYRNATHIQAKGGRKNEELRPVKPTPLPEGRSAVEVLQEATRKGDRATAEGAYAGLAKDTPDDTFNHVMYCVQDDVNVHRVVLAWRAWAMLDFTGQEQAHTLLRQTVLFCANENRQGRPTQIQTLLPKLLDQYKLADRKPGTREADDAWVEALAKVIYGGGREKAADAAAAALAEGFSPEAVAEATALAANQLLLHDPGRGKSNDPAKPTGSVHGDSVGLHASDAANAWRNIARVSNRRNTMASLIVGAYHTAGQNGGQTKEPYHAAELEKVKATDPAALLGQAEDAIKGQNQALTCALVQKYGELGHPARPVLDLLLKYGVSEDGALHAEKYYRTATEEFAAMRPAFRWRQLVALARVTASEYGYPAPGSDQARKLLGV
jgi:hypothetical protein